MATFTRKIKRANAVTLTPDVYAGRILAAKLEVIDDLAQALGVEPTEDELGVIREGCIARARADAIAAVTEAPTPHFVFARSRKKRSALEAKQKAEAVTTSSADGSP